MESSHHGGPGKHNGPLNGPRASYAIVGNILCAQSKEALVKSLKKAKAAKINQIEFMEATKEFFLNKHILWIEWYYY